MLFLHQLTLCTCLAALNASPAFADDSFSAYGFDFVRITDPGNRDTNDDELPGARVGGVEYEYSMCVTEVTVAQHLEFVEAYFPLYVIRTGNKVAFSDFTGPLIHAAFGQVSIVPGHQPDEPSEISWEYAARLLNWFHHGKVIEEWAFDTGAYDTSTFTQDHLGNWLHQEKHDPQARFWLPTRDEWMKAGFWDPTKNNGQGGYWQFPNRSDIEPRLGLPSQGGERNAGEREHGFPLPVGSYAQVQSPWGLLDMSGGQTELFESVSFSGDRSRRFRAGSDVNYQRYGDIFSPDLLGRTSTISAIVPEGIRITSAPYHPVDLNQDGRVDFFDVSQFIRWFIDGDDRADFRKDDVHDIDDVRVFLGLAEIGN